MIVHGHNEERDMSTAEKKEVFEFKSEAKQLLELMIHSIYSTKDVFLRELISNASDAIDKRRFEALTDKSLLPEDEELKVRVWADEEARVLFIKDNGIGMSRDDLIRDLGTIARSGSREFAAKLQEAKGGDIETLIGQFGVGFYSAFIVADRVVVTSRKAGADQAYLFDSKGDGTFEISPAEQTETGTTIALHLKEADPDNNLLDYTREWNIEETIRKYSDFIQYPIELQKTITEEPETNEDAEEDAEPAEPVTRQEWSVVNSQKAIWMRDPDEVEAAEFNEFYRHITHDWTDPIETVSVKAEGTFEYHSLLFIPGRPPFDLFYRDGRFGLRLYVNRVLIEEQSQELLPDYLRFIKGVVDSPDLPLNISREMLQKDRRAGAIKKRLVKKVLDALSDMAKSDDKKYTEFWDNFGRVLKEGITEDFDNRDKIADLLRFDSTYVDKAKAKSKQDTEDNEADENQAEEAPQYTTLERYLNRMKDEQEEIYYITGESDEVVRRSPHLEAFEKRGYEVLFLTDPYDEIMLQGLHEYQGKKLRSVGKGQVELGDEKEREETKAKLDEQSKDLSALLEHIQKDLDEYVKEVKLSARLTESVACLVGEEGDYSPHFKRLLKKAGQTGMPDTKRVLELNPTHPMLTKMKARFDANPEDPTLSKQAQLLHGQALLAEGSPLPDPVAFSHLVGELMLEAS